ncbi:methyltransferase domain-containing protein [Actinophytocola gossypii]|uniref:Methyltransferase domain-containing protein n=1 Tax=Actinophytocola gossypii TaxID=2812003 RepID=A0ABT2JA39_9PSEU|nr:methyltransferase domain-containing protein [Actinophytocola gossypii]MCT2584449.1 methyltransferase domain-containing protein [Actinophytocola gossypii]
MTVAIQPISAGRHDRLDRHLCGTVADALAHDRRTRELDVGVEFRGGVAHVTGSVEHAAELDLVREFVGRFAGVLAVWDRVRVGGRAPVALDIGCGDSKQYPDNLGVDLRPAGAVDLVADLSGGMPVRDGSVDRVFAVHVLEHLVDFLPLVDDCHRVLRPGGVLHVMSPWWRFVNAVADPTHVRLLDTQTFKGICDRPGSDRRWYPRHVGCDGASVFADLTPLPEGAPPPTPEHLARFFD